MLLLVRCTRQNIPTRMTLVLTELRVPVPTVGCIHLVMLKEVCIQKTTSIVMEHNSNWLIPTLGKSSNYYVWNSRIGEQLLFILPTRVSLTTITLHYYSDSVQDLPKLTFYAVPNDIDIWDQPTISYQHASVSPDKESAGCRCVSINVNFNTKKVLKYMFSGN